MTVGHASEPKSWKQSESDLPATRHAYSYLNKQAQRESVHSLPAEVLADFELLHEFELSGQVSHSASRSVS